MSIIFLKNSTRDFHNSPPFGRSACFYMTVSGNFESFQYFNFGTCFLKTKTFFKKLECRFSVESTKIENASCPHKTATSEANVKTNRIVNTKLTYHKERSFTSANLFFWKFYKPLINSWQITNDPVFHIRAFCKLWSCIWRCFSLWVSLSAIG